MIALILACCGLVLVSLSEALDRAGRPARSPALAKIEHGA
jgi:hypothetical protein